jgi:hypothetical protein
MKFKVIVQRVEAVYEIRFSVELRNGDLVLVLEEDQLKAILGVKI